MAPRDWILERREFFRAVAAATAGGIAIDGCAAEPCLSVDPDCGPETLEVQHLSEICVGARSSTYSVVRCGGTVVDNVTKTTMLTSKAPNIIRIDESFLVAAAEGTAEITAVAKSRSGTTLQTSFSVRVNNCAETGPKDDGATG